MPRLASQKAETVYRNAKPKSKEYTIADGHGLFMAVTPDGTKLWDFRYTFGGHRRKLALRGGFPIVSLKAAREKVSEYWALLSKGEDPAELRKAKKEEEAQHAEALRLDKIRKANTFSKVTHEWNERFQGHRGEATRAATLQRLAKDIFPFLGERPVTEITPPELLGVLRRVEQRGRLHTAHYLLSYCRQIFRYAVATGYMEHDVAADLRGALPPPTVGHRAAILDPVRFGGLLRDIDAYEGWYATKYALRILPLVFTRPGELRLAQWSEIDFARSQWDIPASRMKMRLPHTVPLARQVLAILKELHTLSGDGPFLFPTPRQKGAPISNVAVLNGLRRMGYGTNEVSAHGFRATARTFLDERLHVNPAYIEAQLAHRVPDALGTAYNRTMHLEDRKAMMQQWADYLDTLKMSSPTKDDESDLSA